MEVYFIGQGNPPDDASRVVEQLFKLLKLGPASAQWVVFEGRTSSMDDFEQQAVYHQKRRLAIYIVTGSETHLIDHELGLYVSSKEEPIIVKRMVEILNRQRFPQLSQ